MRDEKGRIAPGSESLNPGGLPQWVREVRNALQGGSVEAAEYARSVLKDASEETKNRLFAAKLVLDFTVPKPKQEVEVSGSGVASPLAGLTPEQLLALVKGGK